MSHCFEYPSEKRAEAAAVGRRATGHSLPAVMLLALGAALIAAIPAAAAMVSAEPANAATVSGVVKNGKGYQVVVAQAKGTAKKMTIAKKSGAFSIKGVTLNKASLQLVKADGSYFGPIVLKASGAKAYATIKGSSSLKIGTAVLKSGHALVGNIPAGRYQTTLAYTAKAVRGKPIGAGKLGRVVTGDPQGMKGEGGDLDRDGIVGAFDIDDNGNLILDNVDRTGRGSTRPVARRQAMVAREDPPPPPPAPTPPPPGPGPGPAPTQTDFRMFSNFKLTDATSINVNIAGIADIDGLIERYVPTTVTLATQVIGGSTSTLDGLGNSYIQQHSVGGATYPLVNGSPASYTGTLLNLSVLGSDAQIMPGALPSEIGAGDAFIQTGPDGISYPGTLNFVFNTAPALLSYQFNTEAAPTAVTYDANGVSSAGMTPSTRLRVPSGASSVTLTFWRPQRKATTGEASNAGGWIDIGGLKYRADVPNAPVTPDGSGQSSTHDARGAYSNASANGVPITTTATDEGIIDPAADAAADAGNAVTFTVSFATTFSGWASFGPGTTFDFDIQAQSEYGDNAARKLHFVTQ